jgi:hypothetical protein
MKKGVEILLVAGTRIPLWITNQSLNVKIGRKTVNGRRVRSLKIKKGEASFMGGGAVDVKMPGSREFIVAFPPLKVLEIRDLKENLLERNNFLCKRCFTITGRVLESTPSKEKFGRADFDIICSECGNVWKLKGI